jgi:hypothetical protein
VPAAAGVGEGEGNAVGDGVGVTDGDGVAVGATVGVGVPIDGDACSGELHAATRATTAIAAASASGLALPGRRLKALPREGHAGIPQPPGHLGIPGVGRRIDLTSP